MARLNLFKMWVHMVLGAVFILVGIAAIINVTVDAYGIQRKDFTRQFQVPNENYIKMKYLLSNKNKYDSFVFGSSRAEKIDPKIITNGSYYDMTYPLAVPGEHLENIRVLLKSGVVIKNLLIGLDDFSSRVDPQERISNLELQPHPAVSGKKSEVFYGEYFFKLKRIVPQLDAYIHHNYTCRTCSEETRYVYDMFGSGRILCPACDEEIELDPDAHNRSKKFLKSFPSQGDNVVNALKTMRELVLLAKENDIKLILFINPIHRTTYLDTDLKQFAFFKKNLAAIADYYDFSGLNSITTNNYYYYETSHYRPMVGNMMLKIMMGAPNVDVPRDFGFYTTQKNVDAHIEGQCLEIRDAGVKLNKLNADYIRSCE